MSTFVVIFPLIPLIIYLEITRLNGNVFDKILRRGTINIKVLKFYKFIFSINFLTHCKCVNSSDAPGCPRSICEPYAS